MGRKEFQKELLQIAVPVTLQCLMQSSFSVVDQIMTGQLGSICIAGIGLGGKFASIYSVVIAAVASVAGIMMAQYIGKKDAKEVGRGFYTNLAVALILVGIFTLLSVLIPSQILGLYSNDGITVLEGVKYLRIYALSFLPVAVTSIVSAYLRCVQAAKIPLYAGIFASITNTVLNYVLIFGNAGFPAMGVNGAAWASVIAQLLGCIVTVMLFFLLRRKCSWKIPFEISMDKGYINQYLAILMPLLVSEFFWSLGENVYASIYGHVGTKAFAAMILTNPLQALVMGALSGVSQAAGVMIGKRLGADDSNCAYQDSKRLMYTGLVCSVLISVFIIVLNNYYVLIFNVEEDVRQMTSFLLIVYALVAPVKVQNMILGGILRSGGKTTYVMLIDLIGTWIFGVPLGMLAAFVFNLPIAAVYFVLSMEECIRVIISLVIFRKKKWIQRL
ncbi:MAG: MATE family efflux transporter [Lachnospiraceae bacterium]|nr:MATE family efflux transporter [Lachnospiraceae bacterium]